MEFLKFKADYLFTGSQMLEGGYVLVADQKGKILDIITQNEAGDAVKILKGILSPGFINCHCHLELSHLKNKIPPKTGLIDFVATVVSVRHFHPDEILKAIEIAEAEMIKEGIVAVGDICNNVLTLQQKSKKNLHYYNFIETSGWNPEVAQVRFEKSRLYYDEFISKGFETSIVPHAAYSVSEILWGKITPFFSGRVETIHNQETEHEDPFFLDGSGNFTHLYKLMKIDNSFYKPKKMRSVETYFKHFEKAASLILVHNTFTKQEDLDYIQRNKTDGQVITFCLCPNANLFIENRLPPVDLLIENNCDIVTGTDSLASNNCLSILEELKTVTKSFPHIATQTLLQWATINGARALQMDNLLGSFEKGKSPGIILIEDIADKKITPSSKATKVL